MNPSLPLSEPKTLESDQDWRSLSNHNMEDKTQKQCSRLDNVPNKQPPMGLEE